MARLGRLARLGEMIFTTRSYGIFYLSSIKVVFTINSDVMLLYRTDVLIFFH